MFISKKKKNNILLIYNGNHLQYFVYYMYYNLFEIQ